MDLLVSTLPKDLVISPESRYEEIAQNVRMILTTPKGSVPLDRDFGLDFKVLDQPTSRAQALLSAEIITQVSRYEPRANVTKVDWENFPDEAGDGRLIPRVSLRVES
jgi:phage baseplate assembly protein W